jgi:hypothetical protein
MNIMSADVKIGTHTSKPIQSECHQFHVRQYRIQLLGVEMDCGTVNHVQLALNISLLWGELQG